MDGPRVVMRGLYCLTLPHGRNGNTVGPGWKGAAGHTCCLSPGGTHTPGTQTKLNIMYLMYSLKLLNNKYSIHLTRLKEHTDGFTCHTILQYIEVN